MASVSCTGLTSETGLGWRNEDNSFVTPPQTFSDLSDASDSTYVRSVTSPIGTYDGFFPHDGMASDFDSITTVNIAIRAGLQNTAISDDNTTIEARIVASDTTTVYAGGSGGALVMLKDFVTADGTTIFDFTNSLTLTASGSAATKANWDAALIDLPDGRLALIDTGQGGRRNTPGHSAEKIAS